MSASALSGRPWLQTARGLAWCADEPEAFEHVHDEYVDQRTAADAMTGRAKRRAG